MVAFQPMNNYGRYRPSPDYSYIAFNKPYGVLSQFSSPPGNSKPTLAAFGFPDRCYPLGRLDHDSEGLLLLSDDPRLTSELLTPHRAHQRVYIAQVDDVPSDDDLEQLRRGVTIAGSTTRPASAELLAAPPDIPDRPVPIRSRAAIPTSWIRLTLTEGRNRQVRRMTAAVGHPTLRLMRVAIGRLDLLKLGLAPGEWRPLSMQELSFALDSELSATPPPRRP